MLETTPPMNVIGIMQIEAGTIHNNSFETAAWYQTIEYPAQTVEVRQSGNDVIWAIEGRVTHEHFPSLLGGVRTGGGTMGDRDKPITFTRRVYGYVAAEMIKAGVILPAS
jgi:hypothetical protein